MTSKNQSLLPFVIGEKQYFFYILYKKNPTSRQQL